MHSRTFLTFVAASISAVGAAQQLPLPSAPVPARMLLAATATSQSTTSDTGNASALQTLTRQQAEQLALQHNPHVRVSTLTAMAEKQVVREQRAALLPNLSGDATVVGAEQASRIAAGNLTSSRLLNHAGAGVSFSQLITDFGRTSNLVGSASLQAQAAAQNAQATREAIVLAADVAFYNALEAQATLAVARSTQQARSNVNDQVSALTASKLKSTLDQSFAQVNLSQAKLLVLDAQNQADAAFANLDEVLGLTTDQRYTLVDDADLPAPAAPTVDALVTMAIQQRPDLLAQQAVHNADVRFAKAQRDQLLPTLSAVGVAGAAPVGSSTYFSQNTYGAAGINLSVPIFDGFRYRAEASEAKLRAQASDAQTAVLRDRIVRDVRTAWLAAQTAQQRMQVTAELVKEANMALDLAQTRYQLGLSSIVELSQAQLQQTQAQIDAANARFEYEADIATIRFETGGQP
jgi:outer membrane protein